MLRLWAGEPAEKLDLRSVRPLVQRLDHKDRLTLLTELEKQACERFGEALDVMHDEVREDPISDEDIRRECEGVREERYRNSQGGR